MLQSLKDIVKCFSFNPVKTPPEAIYIEVTGVCNLKCPNCARTYSKNKRGHMSDELFYEVIQKIKIDYPYIAHIGFHFFGEIALKDNFDDLIRYARKMLPNTHFGISTTLTNASSVEKFLNAGFDSIGIWPDSFSEDSYNKIRKGGGSFSSVIENIRHLLDERDQKGMTDSLSIHVGMVRNKINESHIAEFYSVFKFINSYKNTHLTTVDSHDWAGQAQTDDVLYSNKGTLKIPIPCSMPFKILAISANGDATPCCYDMNIGLKIGSIRLSGIKELWTSNEADSIRRNLITFAPKGICRNCGSSHLHPRKLWNKTKRIFYKNGMLSTFDIKNILKVKGKNL